jgi:hypothetical protein
MNRGNGTRQVQVVWGKVGGKRKVEYVGTGRTDEKVELLLVEARERINAGQGVLELGLEGPFRVPGEPLEEVASQMAILWDALNAGFRVLGFHEAVGDDVFRDLVLARIVEPTLKHAAIERVLPEIGVPHVSHRTLARPDFCHRRVPSACGVINLVEGFAQVVGKRFADRQGLLADPFAGIFHSESRRNSR